MMLVPERKVCFLQAPRVLSVGLRGLEALQLALNFQQPEKASLLWLISSRGSSLQLPS